MHNKPGYFYVKNNFYFDPSLKFLGSEWFNQNYYENNLNEL